MVQEEGSLVELPQNSFTLVEKGCVTKTSQFSISRKLKLDKLDKFLGNLVVEAHTNGMNNISS